MMRPCLWAAALAITGLAACSPAHAFTTETPNGGAKGPSPAPAPAPRAPSQNLGKPAAGQSGGYTFSGTSFNLSVTKTGRAGDVPASPANTTAAPGLAVPSERPGFFRRTLNWIFGD
jgi:hypothetical protein